MRSTYTSTREEQFYSEALKENYRQVAKWGIQQHTDAKWLAILVEEIGEVAKAIVEGDDDGLRDELVHVAAVCAQWTARK
jgi:NTP pyrophosphatase (non-canonical NTP hydrolase)